MSDSTQTEQIRAALVSVQNTLAKAATDANRSTESIQLLAVSKKKPLAAIEAAWAAGQQAFGENYVDEAVDKIQALRAKFPHQTPEWHFIGAIQSRKAGLIAQHFDWVHSVDRLKVARKLAQQRPESAQPLSVCIQVNLDEEDSKSGVVSSEVAELADQIAEFPQLQLRGLMSIPAPRQAFDEQRAVFRQLAALLEALKPDHPRLDTLSMGMSADMAAAIHEGATIVRVGTAIFGARHG